MYADLIEREITQDYKVNVDLKLDNAYIVGAGDSYAVALTIESKTNGRFKALDPFEGLFYENLDRPLVIVSVSGRPKSNILLARKFKGKTKLYVITANEESQLAKFADYLILIPYKSSQPLPGTLSFLMSLSAIYSLAGEKGDDIKESDRSLNLTNNPFFIGYKEGYGIAYYAMLKFAEIFGYTTNSERFEQFCHSPIFMTENRQIILFRIGNEREIELINSVDYTDIQFTNCNGAFCNASILIKSIVNKMRKEKWDKIYFLENKKILNVSSKMIY
ncbi:sugar isomerase (SIS) [Sulfolobus islandicus Y.G.57.14]|uniref:Sugar isomerase (SIS) n=1 Tax=Saccharolobus islandicus (strain Y.G.57.14 / Yellowstone \|nr:SIS domain-containing protein [Sulfolobus islandicus]ACP44525.1 sugar isomerase (SIS) [Sulfolobus islandicus Y.G.57.14]